MPLEARPIGAAYATGRWRIIPGFLGAARCQIEVAEPDRTFWRVPSRHEWEWCQRHGERWPEAVKHPSGMDETHKEATR